MDTNIPLYRFKSSSYGTLSDFLESSIVNTLKTVKRRPSNVLKIQHEWTKTRMLVAIWDLEMDQSSILVWLHPFASLLLFNPLDTGTQCLHKRISSMKFQKEIQFSAASKLCLYFFQHRTNSCALDCNWSKSNNWPKDTIYPCLSKVHCSFWHTRCENANRNR